MSGPYNPTSRGTLVQDLPSEEYLSNLSKLWPYRVEIPATADSPQIRHARRQWLEDNICPLQQNLWGIIVGSVINGRIRMIYLFKEHEHSVRFLLTWL